MVCCISSKKVLLRFEPELRTTVILLARLGRAVEEGGPQQVDAILLNSRQLHRHRQVLLREPFLECLLRHTFFALQQNHRFETSMTKRKRSGNPASEHRSSTRPEDETKCAFAEVA